MTIALAIAVFFIIWWLVLFTVLPVGMKTQADDGTVVPGTPASAPAHPRLLRTAIITTLLAGIIFAAVYAVIEFKLVSIDDLSFLTLQSSAP